MDLITIGRGLLVIVILVGGFGHILSIAKDAKDASPLKRCEACKRGISKQAHLCPQCGHPATTP